MFLTICHIDDVYEDVVVNSRSTSTPAVQSEEIELFSNVAYGRV